MRDLYWLLKPWWYSDLCCLRGPCLGPWPFCSRNLWWCQWMVSQPKTMWTSLVWAALWGHVYARILCWARSIPYQLSHGSSGGDVGAGQRVSPPCWMHHLGFSPWVGWSTQLPSKPSFELAHPNTYPIYKLLKHTTAFRGRFYFIFFKFSTFLSGEVTRVEDRYRRTGEWVGLEYMKRNLQRLS